MSKWKERLSRWSFWLVYVALSILMTWPLVLHLSTHLAGSDSDLFNVYWGTWWVRKALAVGQNPYQTQHLLYPVGFDLTTFAFSPFLALLWIPPSWLFSPIAAYNLVVLVTIVLCCIAMEQLVWYLTGNRWAARIAAVVFGFAPCLAAERAAHLNLAMLAWIPWAALLVTRLIREARTRDVWLLVLVLGLAFLTRLHVGILVVLFCGVYSISLILIKKRPWHRYAWRRLLFAGLLSLLLLSPLALHVSRLLAQSGSENVLRERADFQQADLLAYVLPPPRHPLFGAWTKPIYEQRFLANQKYWVYVGVVPLILAIYVSVSRPTKAGPWLLTGLVFFILSLGPCLRFDGRLYRNIKLPYALARDLFTLIAFDVPNRFVLGMMPSLSVLVGLACAEIASRQKTLLPLAGCTCLILTEYLIVPMRLLSLPPDSPFYGQIAAERQDYAIVDLPLTREDGEIHRYYQTIHQKPIVGGWDHRVPTAAFAFIDSSPLLRAWSGRGSPETSLIADLPNLADADVRYIVLHKDQLKSVPAGMESVFHASRPIYQDHNVYVWSTDTSVGETHNVAHTFNTNVKLLQPSATLSTDSSETKLFLSVCWLLSGPSRTVDEYQVALSDPDGSILWKERALLPASIQGLSCGELSWQIASPLASGDFGFHITPFVADRPLGTYTFTQSIQRFQDAGGRDRYLLGQAFPVTFDAPIELPGYHLLGGEGWIWLDLYWHSLADHRQTYKLFVQLIDPVTGQSVANSDDILHRLTWKKRDVVQARRVLFLDGIPPGEYGLGFGLYLQQYPQRRILAYNGNTGQRWQGNLVMLERNVLVLPQTLQDMPLSRQDQVVIYVDAGGQASNEFYRPVNAQFGDVAQLIGYSLESEAIAMAESWRLILYWTASDAEPIQANYKVFVHIVDESGRIIAQHDGEPSMGYRPTRTWRQGDLIADVHQVVWLVDIYSGQASILVGLYDEITQDRLPVHSIGGESSLQDRVSLGQVQIR